MSNKERDRLKVISQVIEGLLSQVRASEFLGLSFRQVSRLVARYRSEGDAGLIHRGRGRESNRRIPKEIKEESLALMKERYSDYGPTLASEVLLERHGLEVSRETVRGWQESAGLRQAKRRRVSHRQWRERRSCFGELVQMDTSEHDWLEGRGEKKIYLISMIDDASSRILARFYESDSTVNNMDLLKRYLKGHGRPVSLYTDRASHFEYTGREGLEAQLSGEKPKTQIGRALGELGIGLILARSPQAKGRVERLFGTLQDRLVKRMRLMGVNDLKGANDCLDRYFIGFWNQRFSVKPSEEVDAHRDIEGYDLEQIFSIQEKRTVGNDYTFSFKNRRYQVERRSVAAGLRGGKIVVETHLTGRVKARFRGQYLELRKLPETASRRTGQVRPKAVGGRGAGTDSASLRPSQPLFRLPNRYPKTGLGTAST